MAENEIIEVHKSIHDKIVRLQKLLKEKYGNDRQFNGEVTIEDTLDFLFYELYYYSWLREFLIELDRDGHKEIFKITRKYGNKSETARSLLHPFIDIKKMNMGWAESEWSHIFPSEGRIDKD